jgi:pimeloyl-ACP methyl ester carboxylesterase
VLGGHSLGGMVCWRYAAQYGDRFAVLCNNNCNSFTNASRVSTLYSSLRFPIQYSPTTLCVSVGFFKQKNFYYFVDFRLKHLILVSPVGVPEIPTDLEDKYKTASPIFRFLIGRWKK